MVETMKKRFGEVQVGDVLLYEGEILYVTRVRDTEIKAESDLVGGTLFWYLRLIELGEDHEFEVRV